MEENQIAKEKIVSFYVRKHKSGMSLIEIRNDLLKRKVLENHINEIIRLLDENILKNETEKTTNNKLKERIWVGYIIMVIGGLFGIAGFIKKEAVGNYYLFAWAPIIAGYLMIRNAKSELFELKETTDLQNQEPDFSLFCQE